MPDALRIFYVLLLTSDDLSDVTPFQLFSRSWRHQLGALERLSTLPRDILEPRHTTEDILIQRIGGMRQLAWLPLNIRALEQANIEELGVFVVCFTGEEEAARRTDIWAKKQNYRPLHVTTTTGSSGTSLDEFSFETLHQHCLEIFQSNPRAFSAEQRTASEAALQNWIEPVKTPSSLKRNGHNIFRPNYMSMDRAARSLEEGSPFIGKSESEYTQRILESCDAVVRMRSEIGFHPIHFLSLIRPGLILSGPALLRPTYARIKLQDSFNEKALEKTLRMIQKQRGLFNQVHVDFLKELGDSKYAQFTLAERQSELEIFTLGTGLFACQTASAVMRLSPGVNHVFPALSGYARNVRSPKVEARLKSQRLFEGIQSELTSAVGNERIQFIKEHGGPIKIISDAPIEWLPIDGLPLGIKYNCSRINSTPGNLLMAFLSLNESIRLHPNDLKKILVVNAFPDSDPLKDILSGAINALRTGWRDKVEIQFKRTPSKEEFIDALNSFDGNILIFDGHGIANSDEPVGKLALGPNSIDVWELRGKVRVPPIVLLSACDTHGIDAASQATVGNGFLAIGAYTVLATLLPVGGIESAGFIARLIYRISDFIPLALQGRPRVLSWSEVIGGMLRMLLATELLDSLVGPPSEEGTPRFSLQTSANVDINSRETDEWFENLLKAIAICNDQPIDTVRKRARRVLARSEAIRYIQLGHPEAILIDDGKVQDRLRLHLEEIADRNREDTTQ